MNRQPNTNCARAPAAGCAHSEGEVRSRAAAHEWLELTPPRATGPPPREFTTARGSDRRRASIAARFDHRMVATVAR